MIKTKCYYFFLTLTLVSILQISAVDCTVYADSFTYEVRFTNYIFLLCPRETRANLIEEFVRGEQTIGELSYMFAVPDKAARRLQQSFDREFEIRNQLSTHMIPDMTLLPGLGAQRRNIVNIAMQTVIPIMIENLSNRIMDDNLCRSLGLLRSVLDPGSFITSYNIERETCIVTSTIGQTEKSSKYKNIGGVIRQIQINDTHRTEPLSYVTAW
ncbi:uncharacterized protein LOC126842720 isoform X2 [Adelges cooleyi]|uniref:uncharacterized protein LOC126842720 isoform X2 n=1 Tax=Adelges cooleyi TaxID=133065 RepID=UPI0021802F63|nr:uncharacterized protein LOC126842720 isoform X2 [Adelges cooleyi]